MTKQLTTEALNAIAVFARGEAIPQMREAVQSLVAQKLLDSASRLPQFREGLIKLVNLGTTDSRAGSEALSLAFRVAASARIMGKEIPKIFHELLHKEPESAHVLEDPKDRMYFGQAMRFAQGEWVISFLGREVVLEDSGENAREALIVAIISKASSVNQVLDSIAIGFRVWEVTTSDVGTSRARRMLRIAQALRPALLQSELTAESGVGESVKALLSSVSGRFELVGEARSEMAIAFLDIIFDIVRLHFSLATEARTFSVVKSLANLFKPAGWPEAVVPATRALARQVEEAIALLAKQEVADSDLRNILVSLIGEVAANHRLIGIDQATAGLSSDIRLWLTGVLPGRNIVETPVAAEAQLRNMERQLASLYREVQQLFVTNNQVHNTSQLPSRVRRVLEQIGLLAAEHRFKLRGEPGAEVAFVPSEHNLGRHGPGARTVRILLPLVEAHGIVGDSRIVLKADVEPL